ncbi:MAG: type I restriction endonuclease [Candidatus Thorarchaeota archaeon]
MIEFIKKHKEKISELKKLDVNEAVTKSNLIDPVFKFLEWDIHNFNEVEHERKVISGNFVDYALKIDGIPKIYVEAKKINDDLSNFKVISQAIGYANDDGIEWCLITNGDKFNLYKTRDPGDLRDKLALEIRISHDYNLEFLDYFKKENIQKDILETELNQILLTNKVINVLEDISNNLPEDFINYLKSKISGLNDSQIKEALKNIEMQFENTILPEEVTISEEITGDISTSTTTSDTIEIALPKARTSDTPGWKKYNYLPFPMKFRRFFPGYKTPFTLKTDIGDLITWVTGTYKEGIEGDPEDGTYISKNFTRFYRSHPELQVGDTLKIVKIEDLYYELEIIKS